MGHTGVVYRATNWIALGVTRGDPVWVDAQGRQVARKRAKHSRTAAEMLALGYTRLPSSPKHKFVFFRSHARLRDFQRAHEQAGDLWGAVAA